MQKSSNIENKFTWRPSPHFNERHGGARPTLIILHATELSQAIDAERIYLDPAGDKTAGPISAHYMIDYDGSVTQFVDEEKRAWHAGKSYWKGETDINSVSIGIELQNNGEEEFPQKQIEVLAALCKDIMRRHDIPCENILGHSDIAPDRKKDPGLHFPWEGFIGKLRAFSES